MALGILVLRRALYHYVGVYTTTLDEGDFVIQPVLKRYFSKKLLLLLKKSKIILKTFLKFTDPMSMEESDVIVLTKSEWCQQTVKMN
jgi:hypothetical protein